MAGPVKTHVYVDFGQDGSFATSGDEITSDINEMSWSRGKNLLWQRAEAARFTAILNNQSKTYTPTYSGSPLYPNVTAGPAIWALVGYPVDDFIGLAGGATLSGRKPNYGGSDGFLAWEGDVTFFSKTGTGVYVPAGTSRQAVLDFSAGASGLGSYEGMYVTVGCQFTRNSSTAGLILRWLNANNFLLARSDGNNLILSQVSAGVLSDLATTTHTWALGAKKWLHAELHSTAGVGAADDDRITLYVDGTQILTTTTSFNSTEQKHGIGGFPAGATDQWDDFGGWASVFQGRVDKVLPDPDPSREKATLLAYDEMERMRRTRVYQLAPSAPANAGSIFNTLAGAVRSSTPFSRISNGVTLLTNASNRKALTRDALTEAYQIQDDEGGFFYLDGWGVWKYEPSGYRSSVLQLAFWTEAPATSDTYGALLGKLRWDDGKAYVENHVVFLFYKLTLYTTQEVWRLDPNLVDDHPAIANGETLEFIAVSGGDGFSSPVTPDAASGDFQVTANADGTGADLSAGCTATVDVTAATGANGNFIRITLVNNSGSAGYVYVLRLRAQQAINSVLAGAPKQDSTSITSFGFRRATHNALHIDTFTTAAARAAARLADRKDLKARVQVTLQNSSTYALMQIVHRRISQQVNLWANTAMGLNDLFWIDNLRISVRDGGKVVEGAYDLTED